MEIKEIKKLKKNLPRFFCEYCDFKCYMKVDWTRHTNTPKHLTCCGGNGLEIQKLKKTYFCSCGKSFATNSGLWKHKKICLEITCEIEKEDKIQLYNNELIDKEVTDKELIMMLIKQNSELLEVLKNGTNNNSNNTNSNNKTFNLQFFLNEPSCFSICSSF